MKKLIILLTIMILLPICVFAEDIDFKYSGNYSLERYTSCSKSSTKTYMDYRMITDPTSDQYNYIRDNMYVDEKTGLLYDEDGFIGVALGSWYGKVGDKYIFYLSSGTELPVVKIEEKDNDDTISGCYQKYDRSVIEFVIDSDIAEEFFGRAANGFILQGNFNNYDLFYGEIVKVQRARKADEYLTIDFTPLVEPKTSIVFDFSEIH